MKKMMVSLVSLSFLVAGMISETYTVKGMHCQFGCANKLQAFIAELDGVEKCTVDFETSLMTVEYDSKKVNEDLIISTVEEKTTYETRKNELPKEKQSFWNRLKGLFS